MPRAMRCRRLFCSAPRARPSPSQRPASFLYSSALPPSRATLLTARFAFLVWQHIRTSAHARFDCVVKPFPSDPKNNKAKCLDACPNCWCWVCDEKIAQCCNWDAHCVCDASPEWAVERSKLKRRAQQAKDAPKATDSADQVNARYAAAQDVANGGGPAATSAAEAQKQEERENNKEDEENEELFADYEPLHLTVGQPHPDPVVETTSLSFAALPPITYQLKLPAGIYQPRTDANPYGGGLSRAQVCTPPHTPLHAARVAPSHAHGRHAARARRALGARILTTPANGSHPHPLGRSLWRARSSRPSRTHASALSRSCRRMSAPASFSATGWASARGANSPALSLIIGSADAR